jgi:hypothetical protein
MRPDSVWRLLLAPGGGRRRAVGSTPGEPLESGDSPGGSRSGESSSGEDAAAGGERSERGERGERSERSQTAAPAPPAPLAPLGAPELLLREPDPSVFVDLVRTKVQPPTSALRVC